MRQTLPEMERWGRSGGQTTFRYIELVDLGTKPGCLEFLFKAGPDRIPVVAPLMMMILVHSPIGQCFINKELIVEAFLPKDLYLDIVIRKPSIAVYEPITKLSYIGCCVGNFVDRV